MYMRVFFGGMMMVKLLKKLLFITVSLGRNLLINIKKDEAYAQSNSYATL